MKNKSKLLYFLLGLMLLVPKSRALPPFITDDCEEASVASKAAELIAAGPGNTLRIKAGTCHWSSQLTLNFPANTIVEGENGTSVLGGDDSTTIIDDYPPTSPLMVWSAGQNFHLRSIFIKGGSGGIHDNGLLQLALSGSPPDFRMDHTHWDMQTYSPVVAQTIIHFVSCPRGVIDHNNIFLHGAGNGPKFVGNCYDATGDEEWHLQTQFGTADFIFSEDNWEESDSKFGASGDCSYGAKQVYRYNTIKRGGIQTHPTKPASRERGCRATEALFNVFKGDVDPDNGFNAIFISAGPAMVIGNSTDYTTYSHFATLHAMRRNMDTYGFVAPPPDFFGACGTSFNGTGSNYDGNQDVTTGYPCLDMPGRGIGDLLSGDFPNVVNLSNAPGTYDSPTAWPRQALEPVYMAMNNFTQFDGSSVRVSPFEFDTMLANRDYYEEEGADDAARNAGQTDSTHPFNGSSGTGYGLRSLRPTTGLVNGVAYWATDAGGNWNTVNVGSNDGCLDIVVSGSWSNCAYTPYTYPHYLVTGDTPASVLRGRNTFQVFFLLLLMAISIRRIVLATPKAVQTVKTKIKVH